MNDFFSIVQRVNRMASVTETDLEKYLDPDDLGSLSRGDVGIIQKILQDRYHEIKWPPVIGKPTYAKKILYWMQMADFVHTKAYKILKDYFGKESFKQDRDDPGKIEILKKVIDKIMSKDKKAEIYAMAVKAAMSGGFDIMKRLVNKQRKNKNQNKKYYTDGYAILKKWQREQTGRPFKKIAPITEDFNIMKNIKKHPTPVKKSLMEPIEVNPPRQIIF